MTDTQDPLFTHDEPGPRFTVLQAARRIAEPGETDATVATQLRNFAQKRVVENRGKRGSGRTAHQLFSWSDLATAAIMRTLTHLGVADNAVLQAASLACYNWKSGEPTVEGVIHPITAALRGYTRGDWWQFRLDLNINADTGQRQLIAHVYDTERMAFPMPADPNEVPMASITIPAFRFAPRILAETDGMT